jgi:hypothetical protein
MWLLATMNSRMGFQSALLRKRLQATFFWAEKGPFPRMDPEMSFKIRLANKTLLLVRKDLLVKAVWYTLVQLAQGHCDNLMPCLAERFFMSLLALANQ